MLSLVGATSWLEGEGVPDASVSGMKRDEKSPGAKRNHFGKESMRGMEETSPVS